MRARRTSIYKPRYSIILRTFQPRETNQEVGKWRKWDLLNKPFVLWVLTTCAVGIVSYCYSNYSACRAHSIEDGEKIENSLLELAGRIDQINWEIDNAKNDMGKTLNAEKSFADPNITFVFLDNKGKSHTEIIYAIKSYMMRWGFLTRETLPTAPTAEMIEDAAAMYEEQHKNKQEQIDDVLYYKAFAVNYDRLMIDAKAAFSSDYAKQYAEHQETLQNSLRRALSSARITVVLALSGAFSPKSCVIRSVWPN